MKNERDHLKGTTLKVYWFILKVGHPVRITEIQRGLDLSTPSLAEYHIKKLVNLGYLKEEQLGFVVERVEIGSFFRFRGALIPFHAAYVVFFSITLLGLLSLTVASGPVTSVDVIAVVSNAVALIASAYETARIFRDMP